MRTFDQLTQDEQMAVVDNVIQDIITATMAGAPPVCFREYEGEIDQAISDAIDIGYSFQYCLQHYIEANRAMKMAMLHYAGSVAKAAYYAEPEEVVLRV